VPRQRAPVLRRGDDQKSVSPFQSFGEETAHVLGQQPVIVPIELYYVLFRFQSIEKLCAGRHCDLD
jgi:hypothetical protein